MKTEIHRDFFLRYSLILILYASLHFGLSADHAEYFQSKLLKSRQEANACCAQCKKLLIRGRGSANPYQSSR